MKIIKLCLFIFFLIANGITVYAQQLAVRSDIKAFIDYTPINSYNIAGNTYIIAEELRDYGFEVIWNENDRTLNIIRKKFATPLYTKELWEKSNAQAEAAYPIYPTDIKTLLDGVAANSYNIGGQTVVQIDELLKYGTVVWDEEDREIAVTVFQNELQQEFDKAENKVAMKRDRAKDFYSDKEYTGQVNEDGLPNGIGILTYNNTHASAGVAYGNSVSILGYFKNGKPTDKIYQQKQLSAGKIGFSNYIYFIGVVDSERTALRSYKVQEMNVTDVIREPNFGISDLPRFWMHDYVPVELFPDEQIYLSGVWFEDNGYRGQKGVTYRNWFNGSDYQTIVETKSADYFGTQVTAYFSEYIRGIETYKDER